jgi:hypothetical protein
MKMNQLFEYEIPMVNIDYKKYVESFDFIWYEIIYDYTFPTFYDFLNGQAIPEYIQDRVRNGTAAFVISVFCESFFNIIPEIYEWAEFRKYEPKSIYYLTGGFSMPVIADRIYGKHLKKRFSSKINVLRFLSCEVYITEDWWAPKFPDIALQKKFMCLNRVSKPHRLAMLSALVENNAIDQCHISYGEKVSDQTSMQAHQRYKCNYLMIGTPLPLDHDKGIEVNNTTPHIGSDIEPYFHNSLFSIVNETFQLNEYTDYDGIPNIFPTDKTYKCFYFFHLPIINGGRGTVAYLRDTGFDMFDDIIDHGYDTIIDEAERFNAVVVEIVRLNAKYSLDDCTRLKLQLKERLLANQHILQYQKSKHVDCIVRDFEAARAAL